MLQLTAKIEIESDKRWVFDKVVSVEITRDSQSLTDTCKIVLPKKIKWQNEDITPLKRGDKIIVSLGYDKKNTICFQGYILQIGAKAPIEITCEDEMLKLKTLPATKKAYKAVNIKTLLEDQKIALNVKVFGEQNLGAFRQSENTVSELLKNLQQQGVRSFFKYEQNGNPTLYCGVLFEKQGGIKQVFDSQKNIIDDSSLEFQNGQDVKIKIKAISIDDKNKKTIVETGDSDGELRTLLAHNKKPEELKRWAEQELQRLKRDGLTGSFETFGACIIDKLDSIALVLDGVKQGLYQVEKNVITYSESGFRQKITIGNRIKE